jgi:hypothetical protein
MILIVWIINLRNRQENLCFWRRRNRNSIREGWVGGRQSIEGWIGGHKATIKYILVAHKERALTELNGYQRLDKMPKTVRLLAVDQEGGYYRLALERSACNLWVCYRFFFFFGKDNHSNNDVKNFLSKHAKPAKEFHPGNLVTYTQHWSS